MDFLRGLCNSIGDVCVDAFSAIGSADPWMLILGIVLGVLCKLPRAEAWANIVRAATDAPVSSQLAWRAHYLSGGIAFMLPTRGGDLIKAALVGGRIRARYSTMVATFAPDGLFESVCGFTLLVWAASTGRLPAPDPSRLASPMGVLIAFAVGLLLFGIAKRSTRVRRALTDARAGCAILGQPGRYVREVVSYQLLSRVLRLGSIMAFLAAFGLPSTITVALVVMAAQGASKVVPVGPGASGVQYGLMLGAFAAMDLPAQHAQTLGYLAGSSVLMTVVSVLIALPIATIELGGCSRAAFARLRATCDEHAEATTIAQTA